MQLAICLFPSYEMKSVSKTDLNAQDTFFGKNKLIFFLVTISGVYM